MGRAAARSDQKISRQLPQICVHLQQRTRTVGHFEHLSRSCLMSVTIFTRESSYCFQRVLVIAILSVRPSVTRVDQSKTVQASITKFLPRLPGRL